MADFRVEFPDYPPAKMPAALPGFIDTSWRNDACPSFTSDQHGLTLWIDFPAAADREHPSWPRYRLQSQDHGVETSELYFETESLAEILTAISDRIITIGSG